MDTPKIDKIQIGKLILIDSKTLNVFYDKFEVQVENLTFKFEFFYNGTERYTNFNKIKDDVYNISFFNLEENKLQGIISPLRFGKIDSINYCFSASCVLSENKQFKTIIFNLFKEIEDEI